MLATIDKSLILLVRIPAENLLYALYALGRTTEASAAIAKAADVRDSIIT
jgi:hypothetical protein